MKLLSLAHMCVPETYKDKHDNVRKFYNGPSPDEVALVDFASNMGYDCVSSTDDLVQLQYQPQPSDSALPLDYEVLRKMEFNSDRKRMSILVKEPDTGLTKLLIKGADSIIKARLDLSQYPEAVSEKVEWFLDTASKLGLRTLLMGIRVVDDNEAVKFLVDCAEAEKDLVNRDRNLEAVYDAFERNIVLIGATAVEDRLQDDVPSTIHSLQAAGIKIWMLTGDKLETAEIKGVVQADHEVDADLTVVWPCRRTGRLHAESGRGQHAKSQRRQNAWSPCRSSGLGNSPCQLDVQVLLPSDCQDLRGRDLLPSVAWTKGRCGEADQARRARDSDPGYRRRSQRCIDDTRSSHWSRPVWKRRNASCPKQ